MIISDIRTIESDDGLKLTATARPESAPGSGAGVMLSPWFEISPRLAGPLNSGDPFAAGFVVPCMYLGENLHVEAPVSTELIAGIDRIQEILSVWEPRLRKIKVSGQVSETVEPFNSNATGCFFSGGVDAWYTLLKHQDEVTHLVLVRGFDMVIGEKEGIWRQASENVRSVAARSGKKVIEVQTNLRSLTDLRRAAWGKRFVGDFWGTLLHGSALAATALCLQRVLGRIFIGATYTYDHLAMWGSHPLLDPLWSTPALQVLHDGAEANRMQKIVRIAESDLALASLRVCYENREQMYNCCECEKCCRTMMALRACGALNRAASFNRPLDLMRARRRVHDPHVFPWYQAIIPIAQAAGDQELVNALRVVIGEKFCFEQSMAKLRERIRSLTPASLRPLVSYAASRQRWKSRLRTVMQSQTQSDPA